MYFFEQERLSTREKTLIGMVNPSLRLQGTVPYICSVLWEHIDPINTVNLKSLAIHLLWALLIMYSYSTEKVHGSFVGVDEKKGTTPAVLKASFL